MELEGDDASGVMSGAPAICWTCGDRLPLAVDIVVFFGISAELPNDRWNYLIESWLSQGIISSF